MFTVLELTWNRLVILSEDPAVRSTDKQKLKGYHQQWCNAKMLFGCALFHDLLKPTAVLCKTLQADELNIVETIEAIMKVTRSIEKLMSTSFEDLPTVKKVSKALKQNEDGHYTIPRC